MSMIHCLRGTVIVKEPSYVVVDVGGVGFHVSVSRRTSHAITIENKIFVFTYLHVKEDAMDLYGFLEDRELAFFELLISVSGVGPKSALAIMDVAELHELSAAIKENRPDMMTRASGIGRKTAERIIVELRQKVDAPQSGEIVKRMEADRDLVEVLVGLGYHKDDARAALLRVNGENISIEDRIKNALKLLGKKGSEEKSFE